VTRSRSSAAGSAGLPPRRSCTRPACRRSSTSRQGNCARWARASWVPAERGAECSGDSALLGAFSERAVQLDIGWEFRRWLDGTVLSAQDLTAKSARLYGEHTYTVHRADLLDAIKRWRCRLPPSGSGKAARSLLGFRSGSVPRVRRRGAGRSRRADRRRRHSLSDPRCAHRARAAHPRLAWCAFRAACPRRRRDGVRPAAPPSACGSALAVTWCTTRSAEAS